MAAQNVIAKSSVVFAWNSLASHTENEASINSTNSVAAAAATANRICEFEGIGSESIGCS